MFFTFARLWQLTALARVPIPRTTLKIEDLEDRCVPTLLGQQLFPADNPWNQQITNAPVATNSAAIINNIVNRYGNGRLHPDFGQDYRNSGDLYGIPYNVVHGNTQAKVSVVIDGYPDESDVQPAPIPPNAVLEGDFQNGPNPGDRGDSHLIVWDEDNNLAYEFFAVSRPSENGDGHWHAAQESVWDMTTDTFRTLGWTSADAAGLAILPGLVRPDEGLPVNEGGQGVINHAIRFTLQNAIVLNQYLYPASHDANPGHNDRTSQPPMGARFRLKADVDLSSLNPEARIIAQAMKDYGMILADNGSNFFFSGASYAVDAGNGFALTWNDNDIQDSTHGLKSLHYSDFEVVDLTPVVTGLDVSAGTAGTAVTIFGQNFSGASGNLQVYFGNAPALAVTVLDDNDIVAVAPPGAGTVDVTIQSGTTAAPDGNNYNNPVFGYGVSDLSAADLFTYLDGSPRTPVVPWQAVVPIGALAGTVIGVNPALSAVPSAQPARAMTVTLDQAGTNPASVMSAGALSRSTTPDEVSASPTRELGTSTPVWVSLDLNRPLEFVATTLDQLSQAPDRA